MSAKKSEAPSVSKEPIAMPAWAKILVGGLALAALMKWTPIVDLCYLFVMIVMIPMTMLAALGLVSYGTIEAVQAQASSIIEAAKQRAAEKLAA